jgi:signal transduction histidine kinase
VADASHELRSPLAVIRQHAEVALAHPERTDTAKLAGTVRAEGDRMHRLVEDLLLLARADEGTVSIRRQPVDLDDVVFDVAAGLRQSSPLRVDTTAVSAGRVAGDQSQLRRMVQNLADNAACHARATIGFVLREDAVGTTQLCVDDDGPGIADADRQRVFERFVRLDGARARDAGGSGLGLAIVAEIVAAHGGTVTVGTSPLGGARFEVAFPSHA